MAVIPSSEVQAAVERAARVVHTKPFCLEHAKAGAPFSYEDGESAKIVTFDRPFEVCIVALRGTHQHVSEHYKSGEAYMIGAPNLVMTPLGYIDGKPVFVDDELIFEPPTAPPQKHVAVPRDRAFPMCSWPAPEKQYPVTGMSFEDALEAIDDFGPRAGLTIEAGQIEAIANAALRHAIDAGQVTLPTYNGAGNQVYVAAHMHETALADMEKASAEIDQLRADYQQQSMELGKAERLLETLGYRSAGNGEWTAPHVFLRPQIDLVRRPVPDTAARDMAIAEAVLEECIDRINDPLNHQNLNAVRAGVASLHKNLAAIISKVQP